tara:strand:+ start:3269 stop:3643 length:375 start_codon:yes stop_codon:yes gene_type:complete
MIDLDETIMRALKPEFEMFMIKLLAHNNIDEIIKQNKICGGKDDLIFFYVLFLKNIITSKNGVSYTYKLLDKKMIDKKKIKKFIYQFLKLNHKSKNNLWSWNEIEEYDISFDWDNKINFTNYEI